MKKTSASVLKRWGEFVVRKGEEKEGERGEGGWMEDGWIDDWWRVGSERGAGSGEPLLPEREAVRIGNRPYTLFGVTPQSYPPLESCPAPHAAPLLWSKGLELAFFERGYDRTPSNKVQYISYDIIYLKVTGSKETNKIRGKIRKM